MIYERTSKERHTQTPKNNHNEHEKENAKKLAFSFTLDAGVFVLIGALPYRHELRRYWQVALRTSGWRRFAPTVRTSMSSYRFLPLAVVTRLAGNVDGALRIQSPCNEERAGARQGGARGIMFRCVCFPRALNERAAKQQRP